MKVIALSLLAAFPNPLKALHLPHVARHDVVVEDSRTAGWRITARQDRFASATPTCTLRRGSMSVQRGVVVFSFPRSTDTANAQFRLDDGALQTAGSVAVEVAGAGVQLVTPDLKNPSSGRVAIPLRVVEAAHKVSIRPNTRSSHRDFILDGLPTALEAAKTLGCAPSNLPAAKTP